MRRRIVWTVIGAVVVALVLAGLGTLVLTSVAAERRATAELADQAAGVVEDAEGGHAERCNRLGV